MISKLRFLLTDIAAYWRRGLVIATLVSVLLTLGLLMRTPFMAEATVEIGGITTDKGDGLVEFRPFEEGNRIEAFFSHEVFANSSIGAGDSCSAQAMYSPDGLRLKVLCRGKTENRTREMILQVLQPLLDRHARLYGFAEKYFGQRRQRVEYLIRSREKIIESLRKPPVSSLSEAKIVEQQMNIDGMLEEQAFEQLLGDRVRPTRIEEASISVVNRKPGLTVWVTVLVLALGSGLLVAAFSARLKRIEA